MKTDRRTRAVEEYIQILEDLSNTEDTTITNYYRHIAKSVERGKIKKSTFEQYIYRLSRIYRFIKETGLNIEDWEPSVIEDFINWVEVTHTTGREVKEVSSYLTMLRMIIRYNLDQDVSSIEERERMRKLLRAINVTANVFDMYLPLDKVEDILDLEGELGDVCTFYLYTGARRGELFRSKYLEEENKLIIMTGKIKKLEGEEWGRELYVNPKLEDRITSALDWAKGRRADEVNMLLKQVIIPILLKESKGVSIPQEVNYEGHLFPYMLRHTAITYQTKVAIKYNISLEVVKHAFGWKVFGATEGMIGRYFHAKAEELSRQSYQLTKNHHWLKEYKIIE